MNIFWFNAVFESVIYFSNTSIFLIWSLLKAAIYISVTKLGFKYMRLMGWSHWICWNISQNVRQLSEKTEFSNSNHERQMNMHSWEDSMVMLISEMANTFEQTSSLPLGLSPLIFTYVVAFLLAIRIISY